MNTLLVIGYVWPEPNSSAAGSRMMQLLQFFLSQNYKITFATTAAKTVHMADLGELGIESVTIALNNASFDSFIKTLSPNIVLFDRFMMEEQFGWRVSNECPKALKILDTEDLHFLRNLRELEFKNQLSTTTFLSDLAKRELASIYRCDLSLIISEKELQLLVEDYNIPASLLFYLPFLLEPSNAVDLPAYEEREHFISIGNFRHQPNFNAVLYLKEEIWPLIMKKLPKAEMHIYGSYPSQKVTQLQNIKDKFYIKGWAQDSRKVVSNAKVSLAALRFGAGLKGKLVETMQCGTPSITTSVGAEGINDTLPWNGFIKNSPEAFADTAITLYTEKDIWYDAQQKGFEILNLRFSKTEHTLRFADRLKYGIEHLEAERHKNIFGQILDHHLLKSTYYLSKFIETKNKLESTQNK